MNLSQTGLDFIKSWEGFRDRPYDDGYGGITIGYGHLIKSGESFGQISREEAEQILARDVQRAVDLVNRLVAVPLTQSQFDAAVSLAFNWGGFPKSQFLELLNSGDYDSAASRLAEHPITSKGKYSQGLANRRAAERDLFYGFYDGVPVYEDEAGVIPDSQPYYQPSDLLDDENGKSGELLTILAIGGLGILLFAIIAGGSSRR